MASFWGTSGGFLDDQDEEEDGEKEDQFTVAGRDGLIFLVDATAGMFEAPSGEERPFDICIKCAKNVLMNKIISSEKDLVSVILFGTVQNKNASDFKGIYVLQDLDMPDADRILELESLIEENKTKDLGQSYDFSFADSLWACSNLFANSTYKIGYKRVMIFTNNDDPHKHSSELKRRAIRKAKDLADLGIIVDLMHLRPKGGDFDINKFFQDVVCFDEDDNATFADPVDKFEELLTRVRFKQTKKRSTGRVPMYLADGLKFAVSLYTTCRSAPKGSYVNVYNKTNEEIKTMTKQICDDTGQELIPTDIKYYQEFGGSKVVFEKEEVDSMKNLKPQVAGLACNDMSIWTLLRVSESRRRPLMPRLVDGIQSYFYASSASEYAIYLKMEFFRIASTTMKTRRIEESGIHLLGFKPRNSVKHYYHVKTSPFMYPDEKTVRGSTTIFTALLKRCLVKDVVPICVFVPRRNAAPKLAALLPQEEELDEHKMQIRPPGFHVISLPFSDDIRKLKFDEPVKAADNEIDKAKVILDKLKFTFSSDRFENPSLQKFYRNLEALALDRDDVEEIKDLTIPNFDKIEEKAGKEIEAFKALVFSAGYDPEAKGTTSKRKAPADSAGAAKKVKTEDVDVQEMARNNQLNKLTVPILKAFCQSNKLKPSSQKKADLIDAINSHFGL